MYQSGAQGETNLAGRPSVHSRRTVYNLKPLKSASLTKAGRQHAAQLLLDDPKPAITAANNDPGLSLTDMHDSVATMPRPIPVPKAAPISDLAKHEHSPPYTKARLANPIECPELR